MFEGCRVTLDVEEGGDVSIDSIPPPPWYRRLFRKDPFGYQRHDSFQCKNVNCGDVVEHSGLAWTDIELMDSRGCWHRFHAYIDTGDNGELGLPSLLIDQLGFERSDTETVSTPFGDVKTCIGQAEARWQGRERLIEFNESGGDDPPKIGTKLLRNHRVTLDRFANRTRICISPSGPIYRRLLSMLYDSISS